MLQNRAEQNNMPGQNKSNLFVKSDHTYYTYTALSVIQNDLPVSDREGGRRRKNTSSSSIGNLNSFCPHDEREQEQEQERELSIDFTPWGAYLCGNHSAVY